MNSEGRKGGAAAQGKTQKRTAQETKRKRTAQGKSAKQTGRITEGQIGLDVAGGLREQQHGWRAGAAKLG